MDSLSAVSEFIRNEVPDWDDDVVATARFKAFSGQRSDWEHKYHFWRELILKVARHLGLFIIRPSQVKNAWFNRGGLTPLCIDHVLYLMYSEGDIMRSGDLVDVTSARLFQLLRKARNLMVRSTTSPELMLDDYLVLTPLVKEKSAEVIKLLSESHWTSSCIITMNKFQDICGGSNAASVLLSFLAGAGKAQYISITKKEFIEGVKVSLSSAPVPAISTLDCDVLHLIWTTVKLQQQIEVIDQRYETSRKSALACLNSGNKKTALRHARELKLASRCREKCTSLLNRVEEVLNVIADAESTKKVSEAMQIGAQAMKQNRLTAEEVELCLQEFEETIDSQKQVERTLESTPSFVGIEDEDIEEEFEKLQLEMQNEDLQQPSPNIGVASTSAETGTLESTDSLIDTLSNLKLQDTSDKKSVSEEFTQPIRTSATKQVALEPA